MYRSRKSLLEYSLLDDGRRPAADLASAWPVPFKQPPAVRRVVTGNGSIGLALQLRQRVWVGVGPSLRKWGGGPSIEGYGTLATSKGFSFAAGGALHRPPKIGPPIGPRLAESAGICVLLVELSGISTVFSKWLSSS